MSILETVSVAKIVYFGVRMERKKERKKERERERKAFLIDSL